jgi:glycerol-3-phosphate acyltransferase PlsX
LASTEKRARSLNNSFSIAVDAMGGDHGPSVTVPAVFDALRRDPDLRVVLVGKADVVEPLLASQRAVFGERLVFLDAPEVVMMDERPQDALRKKKKSSMRIAVDLVKSGEAQACVSAGNTGALMATARFVLKTLPGIDRPALLSRIPAHHGHTLMLDLGANADAVPEHLLHFAVMGTVVAQDLHDAARPRIGLLNIGSEDIKGNDVVQQANKLLSASTLNYIGFVEGTDIFSGKVDVVVTDGFTGNVALKSMEGAGKMFIGALRAELTRNWFRKFGLLFLRSALKAFKKVVDPDEHNGASIVGLNGVVIKSHGSAGAYSFGNAIRVAVIEARKGVPTQIIELLKAQTPAPLESPSAPINTPIAAQES